MHLRTSRGDEKIRDEMRPYFQSISNALSELESAKEHIEKYISAQSAQLARAEEFQLRLSKQSRRVAAIRANVPAELSDSLGLHEDPAPPVSRVPSSNGEGKENHAANNDGPAMQNEKPVKAKTCLKKRAIGNAAPSKPRPGPKPKPKMQKKPAPPPCDDEGDSCLPSIRNVDPGDLDAAPQYVKGRLTVDKISVVVKKLNEIARKKYALLARPFRELNSTDMTTRQEMEDSNCPETDGLQFLTEYDIRTFGGYRLDATVKSVINMLRHTGALKEIRGKNRKRILIIQ